MQFIKFKFVSRLALALGLVVVAAVPGQAGLIIDLQATSAVGATLTNNKLIENATVGAVINFNIVAQITGANGTPGDEGLVSVVVGFLTSNGGPIKANVTGRTLSTAYDATGSGLGVIQDRDADTDLDLGGILANSAAPDWFTARADTAPSATLGASQILGTVQLTVTAATDGSITFNASKRSSATAASWQEDGVLFSNQGLANGFQMGAPVTISAAVIPEPSTLALGGIALAGLAGFQLRRRRAA